MSAASHLWAIGYDNMDRAQEVREKIANLAWDPSRGSKYLILTDIAVVVRHLDGSFSFNREPFPGVANVLACTAVGFLAGLVVAAPLTGAAIGALLGGTLADCTTGNGRIRQQSPSKSMSSIASARDLSGIRPGIRRPARTRVFPVRYC